ncbi:SVSP family protein [Theileria parva strain Muguga]|uniref:Theileria-specific sub-telomeric protein, SVSP family n=1 Tax=Theileria parva TaxID=5875 RepID=Q4N6D2_THEPA|nr:SVSP family protein [Theileria parva strain Muguga]EAN32291.1 SVSP family protein [Theileria parva strain Muguga]|eukprot:XP_764574.1 hypothetical protein [Theileria parva strain Muguga]
MNKHIVYNFVLIFIIIQCVESQDNNPDQPADDEEDEDNFDVLDLEQIIQQRLSRFDDPQYQPQYQQLQESQYPTQPETQPQHYDYYQPELQGYHSELSYYQPQHQYYPGYQPESQGYQPEYQYYQPQPYGQYQPYEIQIQTQEPIPYYVPPQQPGQYYIPPVTQPTQQPSYQNYYPGYPPHQPSYQHQHYEPPVTQPAQQQQYYQPSQPTQTQPQLPQPQYEYYEPSHPSHTTQPQHQYYEPPQTYQPQQYYQHTTAPQTSQQQPIYQYYEPPSTQPQTQPQPQPQTQTEVTQPPQTQTQTVEDDDNFYVTEHDQVQQPQPQKKPTKRKKPITTQQIQPPSGDEDEEDDDEQPIKLKKPRYIKITKHIKFYKRNYLGMLVPMSGEDYVVKHNDRDKAKYDFISNLEQIESDGEIIFEHLYGTPYFSSLTHSKRTNIHILTNGEGFILIKKIRGEWRRTDAPIPDYVKLFKQDLEGNDVLLTKYHYTITFTSNGSFRYSFLPGVECHKIVVDGLVAWEKTEEDEGFPLVFYITPKMSVMVNFENYFKVFERRGSKYTRLFTKSSAGRSKYH